MTYESDDWNSQNHDYLREEIAANRKEQTSELEHGLRETNQKAQKIELKLEKLIYKLAKSCKEGKIEEFVKNLEDKVLGEANSIEIGESCRMDRIKEKLEIAVKVEAYDFMRDVLKKELKYIDSSKYLEGYKHLSNQQEVEYRIEWISQDYNSCLGDLRVLASKYGLYNKDMESRFDKANKKANLLYKIQELSEKDCYIRDKEESAAYFDRLSKKRARLIKGIKKLFK